MSKTGFTREPITTNLVKETNFSFRLAYIPNTIFHLQTAPLPGISGNPVVIATPNTPMNVPGDVLEYEQLSITFLVDENLDNWREIHDWMVKLYTAKDTADYTDLKNESLLNDNLGVGVSDATLSIKTNKQNPNLQVKFREIYPVSLSGLEFSATTDDSSNIVATAEFAYNTYDIEKL